MLTTAFAQALREHISDHDRPLATLACAARSIADLLAAARVQAAAVTASGFDELALALRHALHALWIEYGGDPCQVPDAFGASH
ncbi:hypothetical protein AAFN86_23240 [Roseomonas sp. CAU 1739]|uniref:hypothetical protein n=1 Tax=Roseomonas sp. CAU 1739 TaxID=3140364 RepID=UPI00325C035F